VRKDFAVIGLGRFGASVAEALQEMGHSVLGVDISEARVNALVHFITKVVQADTTDEETLKNLGFRNFDAVVVAIGHEIQASILTTLLLKEMGVKYIVAKAANDLHAKVLYRVGADRVVFPEREMGHRIASNLVSTNILDYIELSPEVSLMEITARGHLASKKLRQLDLRNRFGINVLALKQGQEVNVSPKADDYVNEGDVLVVVGPNNGLQKVGNLCDKG
jgi:trk system potassium uptake protein TrkA